MTAGRFLRPAVVVRAPEIETADNLPEQSLMADANPRARAEPETALLGDPPDATRARPGADADALIRRLETLSTQRRPWEPLWQDLADFVLPRRAGFARATTPGEAVDPRLFDATAIQANDLLAAALHGMLTNPATPWFGLRLAGTADELIIRAGPGVAAISPSAVGNSAGGRTICSIGAGSIRPPN